MYQYERQENYNIIINFQLNSSFSQEFVFAYLKNVHIEMYF